MNIENYERGFAAELLVNSLDFELQLQECVPHYAVCCVDVVIMAVVCQQPAGGRLQHTRVARWPVPGY